MQGCTKRAPSVSRHPGPTHPCSLPCAAKVQVSPQTPAGVEQTHTGVPLASFCPSPPTALETERHLPSPASWPQRKAGRIHVDSGVPSGSLVSLEDKVPPQCRLSTLGRPSHPRLDRHRLQMKVKSSPLIQDPLQDGAGQHGKPRQLIANCPRWNGGTNDRPSPGFPVLLVLFEKENSPRCRDPQVSKTGSPCRQYKQMSPMTPELGI